MCYNEIMQESGEDYIESILVLSNEKDVVRSIDVARHLNVSKPSVSRAMDILEGEGYITFDGDKHIHLTEKGVEKASNVYSRHKLLTDFFVKVSSVSHEVAEQNACRVEHIVSEEIVTGIRNWMEQNR